MWHWMFLTVGWLWYTWRVYTLTVNWATFPNKEEARAIWQRRSNFSICLGAAVLNDTVYALGLVSRWWVLLIGFAVCCIIVALAQPFLVLTSLMLMMRVRAWKVAMGKDPQHSLLGELAIWPYLAAEEKEAYKSLLKRGPPFDNEAVTSLAQRIRERKQSTVLWRNGE